MDTTYHPKAIESAAQTEWEQKKCFKVTEDLNKEKFYCLSMFPYPSGNLHMGHVRNYTIGDVIARYQRMLGKNVLQPIGWDAFGLPAENAAIERKIPPAEWTYQNIAKMREQFKRLGNAYDWKREIATCDPDYYQWEQWFFIKLFEKGLVYKKNSLVNWDPVDQTVLANEQVIDGRGWRSGALVEQREIPQWFLKITAYAEELLNDLNKLEGWPEQVRTMQQNWIGRSEGIVIYFDLPTENECIKVFTTRPDTLMGVTYLAIAPTHPLAKKFANNHPALQKFIEECRQTKMAEADIATLEKKGMDTGHTATHPITGDAIPIWVANFVLMEYGSGAVMAVPAHDQRDWEFANTYHLPLKQVIAPAGNQHIDLTQKAFTEKGHLIASHQFTDLSSDGAKQAIGDYLEQQSLGKRKVHYRLRDWGVSRQRYWGTPIPMIICPSCGTVPVPENQLPVVLPQNVDLTLGGGSPLKHVAEFVNTTCPKCGEDAERETDTFDTFMESSWYYARFACFNQENAMLDDRAKYWTPVDHYIGGIEHAVLHLLYARFFHKLLRDEGLVNSDEPFIRLLTQGMVLKDGSKMSKSKGNTVDPELLIEQYGADTVRLFMIFASPPEQSLEWSDSGVEGCYRFLRRLWAFAAERSQLIKKSNFALNHNDISSINWSQATEEQRNNRRELYLLLSQAQFDYDRCQFNTVVSACMKLLNLLSKIPVEAEHSNTYDHQLINDGFSILLRILSPITPHICHALWQELEYGKLIVEATWPKTAKDALKIDTIEFIIQVNGKRRGQLKIAADADEQTILQAALSLENVQRFVEGKPLQKSIVLPQRKLINLVITETEKNEE